jgi:hypothetical protein
MELGLATGRKPILHFEVVDDKGFFAKVDLAWPEARLAIELDGWKYHGTREAFRQLVGAYDVCQARSRVDHSAPAT